MPPRITDSQRQAVLALLAQGCDRRMIAAQVGVTPGQVSAVAAHVKMGTYENSAGYDAAVEAVQSEARGRVYALLEGAGAGYRKPKRMSGRGRILIGTDAETDEEVVWNPDPSHGAANSLGLSNHLAQVRCAALSSLMKPIRSPLLPGRQQKNCCVKVENSAGVT